MGHVSTPTVRSSILRGFALVVLAASVSACRPSSVAPTATLGGGGGGGGVAADTAGKLSMSADAWSFKYSSPMPAHPRAADGGWQFDFPTVKSVGYLTTSQRPASATQSITAVIAVGVVGEPFFEYRTEAVNTCDVPATVRLFVQRKGDDMSGVGQYEFYRWWSRTAAYQLAPGGAVLVGDLTDPRQWSSVLGKDGSASEAAFRAAMADIGNIGFTFGGGCFYGHGVYLTGSGQAVFTASEFTVR